jgi:HEAT repeat protein
LTERREADCQVLQTLGPAGKAAAPELIQILKGNDALDLNLALMALQAIGVDAETCEKLDALMEQGAPSNARIRIILALGRVKPPSTRTLKALTACLADPAPDVQRYAAQTLGEFGIRTPEIVSSLKKLQASSSNNLDKLVLVCASAALWDVQRDSSMVLPRVLPVLEEELTHFRKSPIPGTGGNRVWGNEQVFTVAGALFERMNLSGTERVTALGLLNAYCEKSGRILIRMLLLPSMMDLGFPPDKCLAVCRDGLSAEEDHYRVQAAQLLVHLGERNPPDGIDLDALLRDRDLGVRIHAAKAHWRKHRHARSVVPVLVETFDRSKYGSYYYSEIQRVALAVLGEIGPEAQDAVGPLETLLSDPNPEVVKMAGDALTKIRK